MRVKSYSIKPEEFDVPGGVTTIFKWELNLDCGNGDVRLYGQTYTSRSAERELKRALRSHRRVMKAIGPNIGTNAAPNEEEK